MRFVTSLQSTQNCQFGHIRRESQNILMGGGGALTHKMWSWARTQPDNSKKGDLRNGHSPNKGNWSCKKRGSLELKLHTAVGAYLLIIFVFKDQWVCFGILKKRGIRKGHQQKKGVLGTGPTRKRGILGAIQVKKVFVFTAAHTCT